LPTVVSRRFGRKVRATLLSTQITRSFQRHAQPCCHAIFEAQVTAQRGQLKNAVVIKAGLSEFPDVAFRGGPGTPGESLGMLEGQSIE